MSREEFFAKLAELENFAEQRAGTYPDYSVERGTWSRVAQCLDQARREFPE